MPGCRVCRSRQLQFITDFGHLSITNQFFTEHDSLPYRQSISWQECQHCGVVQLSNVPPVEQIRPRYSWIHYAEPEGHLDETAQILQRIYPIESGHQIAGFTADDRALLIVFPSVVLAYLTPLSNSVCRKKTKAWDRCRPHGLWSAPLMSRRNGDQRMFWLLVMLWNTVMTLQNFWRHAAISLTRWMPADRSPR